MSRERSIGLVVFAFVNVAVLTTETGAQVTSLTVTPNPANVGSVVTITVNASPLCTDIDVDLGEGTTMHLDNSSVAWPQSIQYTYGQPIGDATRLITASGKSTLCSNLLSARLTLIPELTLAQGGLFGLRCAFVDVGVCLSLPTITFVSGCFKPGCPVVVLGTSFGTTSYGATRGQLLLKGNFPGGSLDLLAGPSWTYTDLYVRGQIPMVTGVLDQTADLQVVTARQLASNRMPVAFIATQEIMPAPLSAVSVSCSSRAGLDTCSPLPPVSFFGFHQDVNSTCNWASTTYGVDQYDLNLKNGWRVQSMTTTDLRTNLPQSYIPSGVQTSFRIGWDTDHICWISYAVRFDIIGPKGVPAQ